MASHFRQFAAPDFQATGAAKKELSKMDYTTHDGRPTHPMKPKFVLEAEAEYERAKLNLDKATEQMLEAGQWDDFVLGQLTFHQDAAYRDMLEARQLWHKNYPAAEMAAAWERA